MKSTDGHPSYLQVFATFARNSLVRDMTFRGNFLIECITSVAWTTIQLLFYILIYRFTDEMGRDTDWHKYPFFVFLSTAMFVNGLMQMFIMQNMQQFSELVRTGKLDFAMTKPINTQFLISFSQMKWSSLSTCMFGMLLLGYSLYRLNYLPGVTEMVLYPLYIVCGVAIMYSLMVCLAATSVWMGRNQNLYEFWFYITNFSRYPIEIYRGGLGQPLQIVFTFFIPILVAINVPARFLARPLTGADWWLAGFALVATAASLLISRWLFARALAGYRSASS